jgi:photosystem II stability/assembly factor-like uncharacterized protein
MKSLLKIFSIMFLLSRLTISQNVTFTEEYNIKKTLNPAIPDTEELAVSENSIRSVNLNWMFENPKVTSEYVNAILHLSDSHVIAAGNTGTILKSTDGGLNWILVSTEDFSGNITAISCKDINTIAIAGNSGFFAISTNGGFLWTVKPTGTSQNLSAVAWLPDNRIIIGGGSKTALVSADMGTTWLPLGIPDAAVNDPNNKTTWSYSAIHYVSTDTFFVGVDGTGMPIQVLKTVDGGTTFVTSVAAGTGTAGTSTGYGVQDITFASDHLTGFASYRSGLGGNLIRTTDAGLTWTKIINSFEPLPSPSPYTTQTVQIRYCVDVSSDGQFVITGGLFGQVLASTNGGTTWSEIYGGVRHGSRDFYSGGFRGVSIASDKSWLISGSWGLIAGSSTPSGAITTRNGSDLPIALRDVSFADDMNGYAVGYQDAQVYTNSSGTIATLAVGAYYRTSDGGVNWIRETGPGLTDVRWNSVKALPSGKVYVAGFKVEAAGIITGVISYSSNFGQSWLEARTTPGELFSIKMLDQNNLAVINFGTTLLKTSDGGIQWDSIYVPVPNSPNSYLFDVEFISPKVLFASTGHGSATQVAHILKSTDGGLTWTSKISNATGRFRHINFLDAKTGITTGVWGATLSRKNVLRSTDGGDTWTEVATGTTREMVSSFLFNKTFGYSAGSAGTTLITEDGSSWGVTVPIFSLDNNRISRSGNKVNTVGFGATISRFNPFTPITVNFAPGKFYNIFPADSTLLTINNLPMTFKWTKANDENPVSYSFVFFDSLKNEITRFNTTDTFYTFAVNDLVSLPKTLLYWNIEANDGTDTVFSYMNSVILDPAIPVELTSFNTSVSGNNVLLSWSTATETNNSGFDVERSSDGTDYSSVSFIKGAGTVTELRSYTYKDENLAPGKYFYRIRQNDYDGSHIYYKYHSAVEITTPFVYSIQQNYPNPFNPATKINFSIAAAGKVTIIVYDILGNEVAEIVNKDMEAGSHSAEFNAAGFTSGIYFYKITAGNFSETMKMLFLK